MGQLQSQIQQPHPTATPDRYSLSSQNNERPKRGILQASLGGGFSAYHPPAKYRFIRTVQSTTISPEIVSDNPPSPAIFEQKVVHIRSVESIKEVENGNKELNSNDYITQPLAQYKNEVALAYRESRRLSRIRRNNECEDDIYMMARRRRVRNKWYDSLSLEQTIRTTQIPVDGGQTTPRYMPWTLGF
jgi:hypothetical protein